MEGYNRIFIVGLILIGLVGVHARNRCGPSAQQSRKSLLAIENAAAPLAAEETPRILKKRSNPHSYPQYPPKSKEGALDLTMKMQREYEEAQRQEQVARRRLEAAESVKITPSSFGPSSSTPEQIEADRKRQNKNRSALLRAMARQAKRKQLQLFNSRANGSGQSRGSTPGPSRHE